MFALLLFNKAMPTFYPVSLVPLSQVFLVEVDIVVVRPVVDVSAAAGPLGIAVAIVVAPLGFVVVPRGIVVGPL